MSQSCFLQGFSFKILSATLSKSWVEGYIYSRVRRNVKSQYFPNRVFCRLDLATGLSPSLGLLSCSATAGTSLQLLACLAHVHHSSSLQPRATSEIQPGVSASLHNLEQFFTLSHTLPLYDSNLNTRLLIAKIQVNLARNKANKMVDKIQPYRFNINIFACTLLSFLFLLNTVCLNASVIVWFWCEVIRVIDGLININKITTLSNRMILTFSIYTVNCEVFNVFFLRYTFIYVYIYIMSLL